MNLKIIQNLDFYLILTTVSKQMYIAILERKLSLLAWAKVGVLPGICLRK